jgi:hypothetical protein
MVWDWICQVRQEAVLALLRCPFAANSDVYVTGMPFTSLLRTALHAEVISHFNIQLQPTHHHHPLTKALQPTV